MAAERYQVFLSFRGSDTRRGFTDHLHTALVRAGIPTFRDNDDVERGQVIRSELQKAIKESRLAIIVISTNYASSEWCLDELVKVLEEKRNTGLKVLPVFYYVQPSQVRNQSGSFAEAFSKHLEADARTEEERREHKQKVNEWRTALREVADLGGKVLENENDGYESKFIQEIVEYVTSKFDQEVWNRFALVRLQYCHAYFTTLIGAVFFLVFICIFIWMTTKILKSWEISDKCSIGRWC